MIGLFERTEKLLYAKGKFGFWDYKLSLLFSIVGFVNKIFVYFSNSILHLEKFDDNGYVSNF